MVSKLISYCIKVFQLRISKDFFRSTLLSSNNATLAHFDASEAGQVVRDTQYILWNLLYILAGMGNWLTDIRFEALRDVWPPWMKAQAVFKMAEDGV